jgi:transcriptional regulator GlxA family with amidase domain
MRHVVILAFPGVNLLDVAGPAQVFTSATELHSAANPSEEAAYRVTVASLGSGLVETTSGIQVNSVSIADLGEPRIDTLLIAGGHGSEAAGGAEEIVDWLLRMRSKVRRIGSICTGAFVLAAAGLANGSRRNIPGLRSNATRFSSRIPGCGAPRESRRVSTSRWRWSSRITAVNSR